MIKLNVNPRKIKTSDCVIRAIAFALDKTWDEVFQELAKIAFKQKRMLNSKEVYEKYLEQQGWQKCKQPRDYYNKKYTVDEWMQEMTSHELCQGKFGNKVIISVANHVTACEKQNGDYHYEIVDTWNCGSKCVGNYWIKIK